MMLWKDLVGKILKPSVSLCACAPLHGKFVREGVWYPCHAPYTVPGIRYNSSRLHLHVFHEQGGVPSEESDGSASVQHCHLGKQNVRGSPVTVKNKHASKAAG